MNRYLLTSTGAAALAATLALAADDQPPTPRALGAAPPMADVKMMSVAGNEISLADAKGPKGTLVIFTCNHCPFVKAWEECTVALGNAALASGVGDHALVCMLEGWDYWVHLMWMKERSGSGFHNGRLR